MKLLSLTLAVLLLNGCASYEYTRQNSDGSSCTVEITSMRDASNSSLAIAGCDVAGTSEFERAALTILEILRELESDR